MLDSFSRLLQAKRGASSEAGQAATIQDLLRVSRGSLEREVVLGSLAFLRDEYHMARTLLMNIDAGDDQHALFESLKRLSAAPVKTLIVLQPGRESTYAKKETTGFGFLTYVGLRWNPNDEDAVEQLTLALRNVEKWMGGDRSALFPSAPFARGKQATVSKVLAKSSFAPLVKKEKPALDFSKDALKKRLPKK